MTATTPTTIAGCFSLAAFAVAVLAGLAGGNPASSILLRAIEAHRRAHPAPEGAAEDPAQPPSAAESTEEEAMVA